MSAHDHALESLAGQTAEAVLDALSALAPDAVVGGEVAVLDGATAPFSAVELPCVAADVSYVGGVVGGNVLLLATDGARQLAAAMMGAEPAGGGELSELELSAVGEAMNQMMSAAAAATGAFLEHEIEISAPRTRTVESADELTELGIGATHAAQAQFTLFGADCRLIQLVPSAFVVRMSRALDELSATSGDGGGAPLRGSLSDIPVRLWAELGRQRMPMAGLVALPPGEVVELDRDPDAAIDLYVDGMRFGAGRLVVTDDGELAVRIEAVAGVASPTETEGD